MNLTKCGSMLSLWLVDELKMSHKVELVQKSRAPTKGETTFIEGRQNQLLPDKGCSSCSSSKQKNIWRSSEWSLRLGLAANSWAEKMGSLTFLVYSALHAIVNSQRVHPPGRSQRAQGSSRPCMCEEGVALPGRAPPPTCHPSPKSWAWRNTTMKVLLEPF